jgi:hypothetical protein
LDAYKSEFAWNAKKNLEKGRPNILRAQELQNCSKEKAGNEEKCTRAQLG